MNGEMASVWSFPPVALLRHAKPASVFPREPACFPIRPPAVLSNLRTPLGNIAASSDGAQRGGAVEKAIDAGAVVTPQCPRHIPYSLLYCLHFGTLLLLPERPRFRSARSSSGRIPV